MSFIKTINKSDPTPEPCETPDLVVISFDLKPCYSTVSFQSGRYDRTKVVFDILIAS